jgi:predicted lipid-binding transport protein (Tim44 family)
MSFTDRLMLWFHVGFVVFTIGPVTIATMSTPRYIRARNIPVLRYLSRMTRVFGAASLGVLLFGIIAGQSLHDMAKAWLTASMTLFVVALVLLVLIMRDQHRAIVALEGSGAGGPAPAAPDAPPPATAEPTAADAEPAASGAQSTATVTASGPGPQHVAHVERGRIASMAGVVSLIWLVILVLMIWNSTGR